MLGYGLAGTLFVVGLVLLVVGYLVTVALAVKIGWILLVAALVVFLVDAVRGGSGRRSRL